MNRNVLVPVDGSPHARDAALLGARVASTGKLTLLHALREGPLFAAAGLDAAITAVTGASNAARQRVRLLEKERAAEVFRETRDALPDSTVVAELTPDGRAADVVLDALESGGFDLVALGSRGRGRLARTLLGSVSDQVLRGARCSVLIARHGTVGGLLVAVDGTPAALRAAAFAGELAREFSVPVTLVHVVDFPVDALEHAQAEVSDLLQAQADAPLDDAEEALGLGVIARRHVAFGDPVEEILAEAERAQANLVVVGRQGETPSRYATLGSVAHRVAHNASASVLVVP